MGAVWISRIGELLEAKSRKERRRVTIEELAEYVKVSRQTVHSWTSYRGVKNLSADYTARICEFFDVGEWELWKLVVNDQPVTQDDDLGQVVEVVPA